MAGHIMCRWGSSLTARRFVSTADGALNTKHCRSTIVSLLTLCSGCWLAMITADIHTVRIMATDVYARLRWLSSVLPIVGLAILLCGRSAGDSRSEGGRTQEGGSKPSNIQVMATAGARESEVSQQLELDKSTSR